MYKYADFLHQENHSIVMHEYDDLLFLIQDLGKLGNELYLLLKNKTKNQILSLKFQFQFK